MYVSVRAMVKDGAYTNLKMTPAQVGQLALAIQEKGYEVVHLHSESIEVAGFFIFSKDAGERVIVIGKADETK